MCAAYHRERYSMRLGQGASFSSKELAQAGADKGGARSFSVDIANGDLGDL